MNVNRLFQASCSGRTGSISADASTSAPSACGGGGAPAGLSRCLEHWLRYDDLELRYHNCV